MIRRMFLLRRRRARMRMRMEMRGRRGRGRGRRGGRRLKGRRGPPESNLL